MLDVQGSEFCGIGELEFRTIYKMMLRLSRVFLHEWCWRCVGGKALEDRKKRVVNISEEIIQCVKENLDGRRRVLDRINLSEKFKDRNG